MSATRRTATEAPAPLAHIRVAHSHHVWLPQTMAWLYDEIRSLPPHVHSTILCEKTENLEQFALQDVRSLLDRSRMAYVWQLALRRIGAKRDLAFVEMELKRSGAAILHSHFGYTGWRNAAVARRAGVRHIVTFYGVDVHAYPRADRRWFERYRSMFANVDAVLCEGPHMARQVEDLGCPAARIRVHHLGVDTDAIPFRPRTRGADEPLRILLAASFVEKKGYVYALDALGMLRDRVPMRITIVGDAADSDRSRAEKRRILEAIARNHLADRVEMLGFVTHERLMEEAYRHHLFIAPSVHASDGDSEGGAPVTLIDMAASGMQVVATRHCDIPEIVLDGETGHLVPERDAGALAQAVCRVAGAPESWAGIAARARRHIEAEYDTRTQGRRLASVYEDVLHG